MCMLHTRSKNAPVQWALSKRHGVMTVYIARDFRPCDHMTSTSSTLMSTFIRQLRFYRFIEIEPQMWYHPNYQPNCPHLIPHVVSRRTKFPRRSVDKSVPSVSRQIAV